MYVAARRYGTTSYYGKRKPRLTGLRIVKRGENWYTVMRFDDGSKARIKLDDSDMIVDIEEA